MPGSIESSEGGGELLLRGLSQLSVLDQQVKDAHLPLPLEEIGKAFQTLIAAIQKNATCASFLAVRVFYTPRLRETYISLSTLSIGKNNDCRGLDELLTKDHPQVFQMVCSWGCYFPPILVGRAMGIKWWSITAYQQREQLLARAILGYGDHVPPNVLANAAHTKSQLNLWKEADELYTKAIIAYGDKVPPRTWADAADTKFRLKLWKEADELWTKAIIAYGDQVPPLVLLWAGLTKLEL
jgi:tetratricopeptide (TPR) repeat protein